MGEITIERLPEGGGDLGKLMELLPAGVQVSSVRQEHHNRLPDPAIQLQRGDGLLIAAETAAAIEETAALLGRLDPGRIARDRADVNYQRFFVSNRTLSGIPLADLPMPSGVPMRIVHVRRHDVDLVPSPDLMLEIGDRVGVLVANEDVARARLHFGDTLKSTAEFSYVSVGFGMVLGVLLGLLPIPVPGVGVVTLGIGGGPLIVALILGRLRRTGPISWVMPLPANIVLRNFGLTLFLASVGINSGQAFVSTVATQGPLLLIIGALVLLTTVAIVLLGRALPAEAAVRRPARGGLRRHRQPGDPGLCRAHGADGTAGHRLCDDLPFRDDREGHRGAGDRPRRARWLKCTAEPWTGWRHYAMAVPVVADALTRLPR